MADKENNAEIIPRKLSFTNSKNDSRSRSTSYTENNPINFPGSDASAVPLVNNDNSRNKNDDAVPFSNQQIYKNLVILSIAFLFLCTAYASISVLQSSLNVKGNVGVNALIVMNVFVLFCSLFVTNVAMDIFGLKWSLVISTIAYISYFTANVRPTPIPMYITAAFVGVVSAPYWASQANYISRIASYHACLIHTNVGHVVSLFFGIFFTAVGTCGIWGNLVSYFVLNQTNHPQRFNCGIHFDPVSAAATTTSTDVSDAIRYLLCGIFIGMSVLSLLLLLSLDQIRLAERQPVSQSLKKSLEVVSSFFRWQHVDQFLLVPITMWSMIENSFLSAQFTRAFITCLVGIRYIGLILTAGGICNALFSYVFGRLAKHIGRSGCLLIAAVLNYGSIFAMYFWEPRDDQIYILYIISCMWNIADAVWSSQVVAVYTVLYAETDPNALTKYQFWRGTGALVTFGWASYISIEITLFILFAVLTVGILGYGIVEIRFRRKTKIEKSKISFTDC